MFSMMIFLVIYSLFDVGINLIIGIVISGIIPITVAYPMVLIIYFSWDQVEEKNKALKKLNTLLENQKNELSAAKEIAEKAALAKTSFLASMSHEIRTPMNGVIGITNLLSETTLSSEQREYVEIVRTSGENLLTIINDILDFAKIESGKLDLEEIEFTLSKSIEETLDLLSFLATHKGLALLYYIEPDVPQNIITDETRLRQILLNLAGNAIKFTSVGEVYIHVQKVKSSDSKTRLQFAIHDTGMGIPQDKQESLFTAFSQVDASTTRKYGGTGLGLAIASRLCKLMGGKIWVESEEGNGSVFSFTIDVEPGKVIQDIGFTNGFKNLQNNTALIIDNNSTNQSIISKQLQNLQINSQSVSSYKKASSILKTNGSVDFVIADLQKPGMDTLEICSEIRNIETYNNIPIIFLSPDNKSPENENSQPITLSIKKPVKQSHLFNAILGIFNLSDKDFITKKSNNIKIDSNLSKRYPLRFLIAEDNTINQKLLFMILEKMGYHADIVANGLEAVNAVNSKDYDVIFMDVEMPEMDGLDATREILKDKKKSNLPSIVAMTAKVMEGDREKCLKAGMVDFISKPIHFDKLHSAIEKLGKEIIM